MFVAAVAATLFAQIAAQPLDDAGAAPAEAPEVVDAGALVQDAGQPGEVQAVEAAPFDAGSPPAAIAAEPPDAGAAAHDEVAPGAQTVVTGTRTPSKLQDAIVPTEVITRAQIESYGVRDLGQLLNQQPGVEVFYTFRGAGIRLQGLDPEYVLILIDGERVTGRVGNTIDLSRFSLRDIERVEIVKGPSAALYGADAIGGVVNLITRRVTRPLEGAVRLQGGTSFRGGQNDEWDVRAHGGLRKGPFEVRVGGGYRGLRGFDLNGADAATDGPGGFRFDGDLMVIFAPVDNLEVKGKVGYLWRDSAAVDVAPTGAVFDRRGRTEQFDASLGAVWKPVVGTNLAIHARYGLFRDQLQQDQRGASYLDTYSANLDRLWEGQLQWDQKLGPHLVSLGGEVITESLLSPRIVGNVAFRYRLSGFVQDEWVQSGGALGNMKLTVLPGLRYDYDSQFSGALSPRLAVKMDPWPWLTIRAAWGMGFRPPSFQELYLLFENSSVGYVVQGNPALKPEQSQGVNLSIDWRLPLDGWLISLSGFRTWLTDMINVNTEAPVDPDNPALFTYANVDRAYTQGIEASARMRLSAGTYVDLGYTLLDARNETTGQYLEARAAHRWNAAITSKYRPIGLEGTLRANLVSSRPFYEDPDGDGVTTPVWSAPYCDLDLQLTYRFRTLFSVFLGVSNLLNAGDAKYLPRPPRQFYAGAQVTY